MSFTIREGRTDEIDRLVALRTAMFEAMGHDEPDTLERVALASRAYFVAQMPSGVFRVWVAVASGACTGGPKGSAQTATCGGGDIASGEPMASIGLVVHSVPPGPSNLAGKEGYIMNLVTLPGWRRCGVARALLSHVLDVLRTEGVPVASLHASADGRALYEQLGFSADAGLPEMKIRL